MRRTVSARAERGTRYSEIRSHLEASETITHLERNEVRIYTPQNVGGRTNWDALRVGRDIRILLPDIACADAERDSIHMRVALAQHLSKGTGVIAGESARWIYEGGPIPQPLYAYYSPYAKRPQGKHIKGKRRRLKPHEITTVLGLQVTTPQCTASDLQLDYEILEPVIR